MDTYTCNLSLWVEHSDADLSAVPTKLGLPASRLWRKGDHITTPTGRVMEGDYRKSYCNIRLTDHSTDLSEALASALKLLEPHKAYLRQLTSEGMQLRFFVGWYSRGQNSRDIVGWRIFQEMADLTISLDIDFYGPDSGPEAAIDS